MAGARTALDGLENAQFGIQYNFNKTTVFSYTSHINCTAMARIKQDRSGNYTLTRTGMHTTDMAPQEVQRTGIHRPLLAEIDNLLLGGQGPAKCLNTLQVRYKDSPEQLALLPTASQLKNRAQKLRKRGDFSITTYADVMEWAAPRMCTTKEQFFQNMEFSFEQDGDRICKESFSYQNDLLVLSCFTDTPESGDVSIGVIFTLRRLFRTAPRMMYGQKCDQLGATDGTYKLHVGGWTLVSFGTYGVRYTASHKYQHKFYPMAFMFVRTKTATTYAKLFSICKLRSQEFFGGDLNLQLVSMDHSQAIANAFRQEWPDIKLLNCWPHLFRKARGKMHLLVERERYFEIIKHQLEYLSVARTADQFEVLTELVLENWATLGEIEYAQWIQDKYLTEPWYLWFATASDTPGVVPNQNPLESCNFVIKAVAVTHLRAATGHVLAGTLPGILVACANDIGTEMIRQFASGPVGAEYLQAALGLCEDDNHHPTHKRKSRRDITSIQMYYFNADYYVVRDENLNGLKFDGRRSRTYEASRNGKLMDERVENIQLLSFASRCESPGTNSF